MAEQAQRTDGPWKVSEVRLELTDQDNAPQFSVTAVVLGQTLVIADVSACMDFSEEETRENAYLISAAKEMRDALKHALKAIENFPGKEHPMTASEILFKQALAKATPPSSLRITDAGREYIEKLKAGS